MTVPALKKGVIRHVVQLSHDITVYQRTCDFCDALTPLPTVEQLDAATIAANTRGLGAMVPSIADETGSEQGYAPFGRNCLFRLVGWELFNKKWACPECVSRAQKALEKK
jgi:hypothetical protein